MKLRDSTPLLSDLAYERILQALFDSKVPMGARVSQTDLVNLTGVPVGPVRDALKVLEADGIVIVHPRSGIEVIRPSAELVRSTFQFRLIIEKAATRTFAISAPEAQLRRLLALHKESCEAISTSETNANVATELSTIEESFHTPVVASLGNELVDASYRRLQLMARIVKDKGAVFPRAALKSLTEHIAVIDACLARDPDAAEAAIAQHLSNAMHRNLGLD
ncbi:GntR family transcriptional regulator [Flavimaricola marinus]|uniref:Transcriptional regulator NanR n=1 Tax=Flavimaricola marinus TaxID=1819565 RepID=A0A238LK02_9RHOB|nr:GntR family transcriptional regulator [Flavimaricola marinus]SMY10001.1 transcriptional regulator NanR [Flavimaricola marinus]